jgi:REP element-mobilizing transposase RayT
MPRHLRFQQTSWSTHHIVSRCTQGFGFLIPHPHITALTTGALAYALEQHEGLITLQHHAFLSNHFHLLISSKTRTDLASFMNLFKSKLTRELNRIHDWKGSIWEGRYASEELIDEESLIEVFKYITKNSIKEGLVDHPREWTGLHGYHQLVERLPLAGPYVHRTRLYKERGLTEQEATTHPEARLLPPPMWEQEGVEAYYERATALCEEAILEVRQSRKGRALGMKRVLESPVFQARKPSSPPSRPLCRAKCVQLLKAFRDRYYAFKREFQEVSGELRRAVHLGLPMPQLCFPVGGVPLFGGHQRVCRNMSMSQQKMS